MFRHPNKVKQSGVAHRVIANKVKQSGFPHATLDCFTTFAMTGQIAIRMENPYSDKALLVAKATQHIFCPYSLITGRNRMK
ncbi:MAG: hypothetical protein LBB84_00665 [Tannerellaceae bacterium]|jgi:hypothetical protein|nr:hypothetical protein [Tannerellaceae bacterium]